MLGIAFQSLFTAFLPVGAMAFAITWWALKRGHLTETGDFNALSGEIKALGKSQKKKSSKINPVHDKWLKFGGGFYGLVALYTYVLVEWGEVTEFLRGLPGLVVDFSIGGLVDLLVNFFIESLTNFIAAITWPVFWIDVVSAEKLWIWIALAYAGYWIGTTQAQQRFTSNGKQEEGDA